MGTAIHCAMCMKSDCRFCPSTACVRTHRLFTRLQLLHFRAEYNNETPPLGREQVLINEDIGTIGEGRAARKLVEFDGVEILLNPVHGYSYYRDWLVGFVSHNDRPFKPSVHGGAIDRTIGGNPCQPGGMTVHAPGRTLSPRCVGGGRG